MLNAETIDETAELPGKDDFASSSGKPQLPAQTYIGSPDTMAIHGTHLGYSVDSK